MESYGYDTEKETKAEEAAEEVAKPAEEVIEETSDAPVSCVYEHYTGVYSLHPEVEAINDNLYISVSEVSEEDQVSLSESDIPSLETVDFEDASYNLGEIFEDPEGKAFVQLTPA